MWQLYFIPGRPYSKDLITYNCTADFVCRLATSHHRAEQSLSGHCWMKWLSWDTATPGQEGIICPESWLLTGFVTLLWRTRQCWPCLRNLLEMTKVAQITECGWMLHRKLKKVLRITGSGLCASSRIPNTRKLNVSDTRSVSVLRWGGRRHILCWVPYRELTSITGPQGSVPSRRKRSFSSSWHPDWFRMNPASCALRHLGHEVDPSPPSSGKVAFNWTSTPPYVLMAWYLHMGTVLPLP
jgi:hypothetical protein